MTAEATIHTLLCSKCGLAGEFRKGHRQCRQCEKTMSWEARQTPEVRTRQAAYREANREKYRKQNVEIVRRNRAERHAKIDEIKGRPCTDCKRNFPPYVMDFDHRDPTAKEHEISHLLNKTMAPWARILTEIEKCDVVCVCCHRLRTWKPPKNVAAKDRLVRSLKGETCADCNGTFHYCQLDFDHVRGVKLGCVPHMSTRMMPVEAAKCDVVCANCHRVRTHDLPRGQKRNDPNTINMVWERQGKGPQTLVAERAEVVPYPLKSDTPVPRSWHCLAGTIPDDEVARIGGVTRAMVGMYRKRVDILSHRVRSPAFAAWHALVGTMTDSQLARHVGISRKTIQIHRVAYDLPDGPRAHNKRVINHG